MTTNEGGTPQQRGYRIQPKGSGQRCWYRMRATGNQSAELSILADIGDGGVTARAFAADLQALGDLKQITLNIHSTGGDVFEGLAIYNLLLHHSARIQVRVLGLAASMASVIAMAGDTVAMAENAMMMIHKPWGLTGGNAQDIRDYADLLDKTEHAMIRAYTRKTGKNAQEIAALAAAETWLNSGEAIAQGFADSVIQPVKKLNAIQSKRTEEYRNMPDNVKNMLLTPRGAIMETETPDIKAAAPDAEMQGIKTAASGTHVAASLPPDSAAAQAVREQVMAEQKQRIEGIRATFALFGDRHAGLMAGCLADVNCSAEQAKDRLLAELGNSASASDYTGAPQNRVHIHAGNGNITGDSVRAALMYRAGHASAQADNPLNGFNLRELARASLTGRGIGVTTYNPQQMVGLAFTHTTSDFGNILMDVAHKSLMQGWAQADETFEAWTKKGQLPDYRPAYRVGLGNFPQLPLVREGAEYTYATLGDTRAMVILAKYGQLFSITREAIINDDMSMLQEIPHELGKAAKRTIGDMVYAVLTQNAKLSTDNVPLFDQAKHGNDISGVMDVATLDEGRRTMRLQKEGHAPLNIRPAFVLVPVSLESQALQVIRSGSVKGADINAGIVNPVQDFAQVIAEPRLDADSVTSFYLAAAKGTSTIEVSWLEGADAPYFEQRDGFSIDGVDTKVRIEAGVSPLDYRGLLRVKAPSGVK